MQTVDETVNLCIAHDTEMVVIDQQVSNQMLRLDSFIGHPFQFYFLPLDSFSAPAAAADGGAAAPAGQ